jgi:hypothetical protein
MRSGSFLLALPAVMAAAALVACDGKQGDLGPVGPVGPTGSVGPAGSVGPTGAVGPTGPAGPNWTAPTVAGGPAGKPAATKSFDLECAGCHFTGILPNYAY